MNLWIEMDLSVKHRQLRQAVEYGWLKKDFVEEMILLDKKEKWGRYASKRNLNIGSRVAR